MKPRSCPEDQTLQQERSPKSFLPVLGAGAGARAPGAGAGAAQTRSSYSTRAGAI